MRQQVRPIIALDFPDAATTRQFLAQFGQDSHLFVKVGMELFYAAGPDIVREITAAGHDVFLDLKLHDIPHTVEMGMRSIARLGVTMTTTHISGGSAMMQAARAGLDAGAGSKRPLLLGITQLTSTSEDQMHSEQHIPGSLQADVLHRAQLAQASGCDGVVCSAMEASAVLGATNPDFLRITPGIRPANAAANDQVRVVTPAQAGQLGSSGIVVGRPITQAADPVAAYAQIKRSWNGDTNDID
ncbi:orotidine-5'-phosphate decarboxylase [Lacticaseibacillus sharpeae]|nr:orotidine-5'-phosphate decarboxylase [Lacticaseibacillus sharpeae]